MEINQKSSDANYRTKKDFRSGYQGKGNFRRKPQGGYPIRHSNDYGDDQNFRTQRS